MTSIPPSHTASPYFNGQTQPARTRFAALQTAPQTTVQFGHDGHDHVHETEEKTESKNEAKSENRLKFAFKMAAQQAFNPSKIMTDLIWTGAFAAGITILSAGIAGLAMLPMVPACIGASALLRGIGGFIRGYQQPEATSSSASKAEKSEKSEEPEAEESKTGEAKAE